MRLEAVLCKGVSRGRASVCFKGKRKRVFENDLEASGAEEQGQEEGAVHDLHVGQDERAFSLWRARTKRDDADECVDLQQVGDETWGR